MKASAGYSSFITIQLFEPVLELLKDLEELPDQPPNEVQAGYLENGYSAVLIVLSITILESAITRVRYLEKSLDARRSAADYFIAMCDDKVLRDQVDEIVAVRDSIIHSHVWEGQVYWTEEPELK